MYESVLSTDEEKLAVNDVTPWEALLCGDAAPEEVLSLACANGVLQSV